jgi:holliday junction DNA helicase RuvB
LGFAYLTGQGASENHGEAANWFRESAAQGNAAAQYSLAVLYEKGGSVPQDYVEAYKLAKLAAAQGYEGAQKKREELAHKLSAEQIEAAEPADQFLWRQERLIPNTFSDFIGQERIKARLELAIAAARRRGEALSHVLLTGSPGSGKSTLVNIIAKAMDANVKATNGQTISKASDLAGLLTNLEEGDVLFIEDIHRLQKTIEEYLYPAMDVYKLDFIIDQGPNARSVRLNLPHFTLIGTTTQKEKLSYNLLSCFHIIEAFESYSANEFLEIVRRFARALNIVIDEDAAGQVARTADGTPLDALNRLRHIRDYALVKKSSQKITGEIAGEALKLIAATEQKPDSEGARQGIPSEVRREVWRRDGGKCVKCGSRENLEYDHIIPVAKGGSNTARNIELLCEACNRAKSDLIQ